MDATWTLNELVEEASSALARVPAPDNGQIRAVPDERSLRYYTTLGLLDRPAAMRGRTALYGKRHLAQVVAIKRMQTAGKSLADIQPILASIDDATLSRLSGIALPKAARGARPEFWRSPIPAPTTTVTDTVTATDTPTVSDTATVSDTVTATAASSARLSLRLSLAPGVDLLVDTTTAPGAGLDLPAIAAAAATLLAELTRQGLGPEARRESADSPRPSAPKDGGSR